MKRSDKISLEPKADLIMQDLLSANVGWLWMAL
jgi:hypothetical protein